MKVDELKNLLENSNQNLDVIARLLNPNTDKWLEKPLLSNDLEFFIDKGRFVISGISDKTISDIS